MRSITKQGRWFIAPQKRVTHFLATKSSFSPESHDGTIPSPPIKVGTRVNAVDLSISNSLSFILLPFIHGFSRDSGVRFSGFFGFVIFNT
ncbi:MAG: hypothetical protein V3U75_07415, partial [Methylococcaceae bacterium]